MQKFEKYVIGNDMPHSQNFRTFRDIFPGKDEGHPSARMKRQILPNKKKNFDINLIEVTNEISAVRQRISSTDVLTNRKRGIELTEGELQIKHDKRRK